MADPIPGEWLSAAALAIEAQPAGSSSAQLAMAVLTAVVPLARAEREPGTVTEWALAYTHRPDFPGQAARRVIQPYPGEAEAREAVAEVRRLAPEDEPALMSRKIGPWKEAPDA